ncbi:Nucleotide/sugar transporter family protein isoform 2 [Hibiscus syriacus]|uniref:Nucleotide/sugar transporter family protein isoform 2 n=1 Tax=Hibiscus syriacus TaxID=106335 RepID=A0A6A2YIA1_HIBSY|nr:Nucleotide/sugar transporter family protein isoform 2 [Hibiscus syriacus]
MLCSREIFKFLVRKDVRKILKRKDSDAGERGKALEDLRASLFKKFYSVDGAKHQRTCGPVAALTFNFMVAVAIIFINKWVLKNVGFEFPVFLTFIHYAVSWVLMVILHSFSLFPASPPTKSTSLSLFTLGIVMSLSTGLANVSLKYNRIYQMAKIAVTPSIVLAEFYGIRESHFLQGIVIHHVDRIMFLKTWRVSELSKTLEFICVIALTVVSIGVAIATVTDLQFSLFGACVAMAWIIPSAINKILWSNLQQQENWTALSYEFVEQVNVENNTNHSAVSGSMIPFLDPPGVLAFHWSFNFLDPPGVLAFHWSFTIHRQSSCQLFSVSCFSGRELWHLGNTYLCIFINVGNVCYLPRGSRSIQNLCSASRKFLPLWFESRHNQYLWSVYSYWRRVPFTYLNLNAKKQPAPLTSLPKSKFSECNGESRHGNGPDSV